MEFVKLRSMQRIPEADRSYQAMRIIDEECLNVFRRKTVCEWSGERVSSGCDPHHIFAKGMGGAGRIDLPCNVVALSRLVHTRSHAGHEPSRMQLQTIASRREGCMPDDIRDLVHFVRRLPKKATREQIEAEMRELRGTVQDLARRQLKGLAT